MRILLSLSFIAAALATRAAKLLWQQSYPDYTFSSANINRHAAAPPTFVATASFALKPTFLEVYNISDSGDNVWEYEDDRNGGSLAVVSARHTEGQESPSSAVPVDVAAALIPPSDATVHNCTVLGFASLGEGAPAWTFSRANCAVYSIDMSDDGSTVVVSGGIDIGAPKLAPIVFCLEGQSGRVRWTVGGDDASQYGGSVMVTERGAFIAYTRGDDTVIVLSGATGQPRGLALDMGWDTRAQLSDTGSFLAFSGQDTANIYHFNNASGNYEMAYTFAPPGPSHAWYSTTTSVSSDGTGAEMGELACFGFICGNGPNSNCSGTALQARVIIASMVTGNILTDYFTPM